MGTRRSAIRSERSKKRQGRQVKLTAVFVFLAIIFVIGGLSWVAHNERLLIDRIRIEGARSVDAGAVTELTEECISGSYLWIFPKKNIFLFPKNRLESEILDRYKQIKDVIISRDDLGTIVISISEREPFALWCDGEAPVDEDDTNVGNCYFLDDKGYIFIKAPYFQDNTYFKLYGKPFINVEHKETKEENDVNEELQEKNEDDEKDGDSETTNEKENVNDDIPDRDETEKTEYIGIYFLSPQDFARIMQFVNSLDKINMQSYALIADAPDMYELSLLSGGRLRFLPEQDLDRAVDDLATAYEKKFSNELPDGSNIFPEDIEYVDIRFNNKVLFKFKK